MQNNTGQSPIPASQRAGTGMANGSINIKLQYPYTDDYDYYTSLKRINLDEERINDIKSGKGFPISAPKGIKKDVKLQNGIFSSRFGSTITDVDSFNGKYRCKCGMLKGSIMKGERCDSCGTMVKFYGDDVSIFGWLILKDKYWIIHPNIYRTLEGFIGPARLNRIIEPDVVVNSDGQVIKKAEPKKKDEPFAGIGILEFKERYDEILNFYAQKYPAKANYYNDLKQNKPITFTHSIAVFSALLRPSSIDQGSLRYESTNEQYQLLSSLVYNCNKDRLKIDQKIKEKLNLLYDIQFQYNAVYEELKEILSKKKGDFRSAIGGRYSFTSRSVIRQDPYLRCDEIKLPFQGLLEMCQQVIINILVRSYNCSYSDAYKKWYKTVIRGYDQTIYDILDGLIKDTGGLPVLINKIVAYYSNIVRYLF